MKRLLGALLTLGGLASGCSPDTGLTPSGEFTREFADALRSSSRDLTVEVVQDLQLRIVTGGGQESTYFLNNAYEMYMQAPADKVSIIQRYIAAASETASSEQTVIDTKRIVPVVKDREWLEETRRALRDRGTQKLPDNYYEDLNTDLVVLYAEDLPKNIRYLSRAALTDAKIPLDGLRGFAAANLLRLIPKIERHGADGLYVLTAGGDYEASLLVMDSIWNGGQMEVRGDIVVAIPTRDLLIVTGSDDTDNLAKMKEMVQIAYGQGSYRLTPKLFVYRNGKFEAFGPQ